VTLSILGFFIGESNQFSGMSPYSSAYAKFEEKVFQRVEEKRRVDLQLYEKKVKADILKIMSGYKTGLDDDDFNKLPDWIYAQSQRYGYDPLFLTALIQTESSFNNWARSSRGALGLMQIRPATGHAMAFETQTKWLGNPTLYDPGANIALGAYYLNKMVLKFGDLQLALEAYNRGPSSLARHLKNGNRPSRYSSKVFKHYKNNRLRTI
jgi:soluble lytic murein transglycosylase